MKERVCAIVNGYVISAVEMTNSEILEAIEKAKENTSKPGNARLPGDRLPDLTRQAKKGSEG